MTLPIRRAINDQNLSVLFDVLLDKGDGYMEVIGPNNEVKGSIAAIDENVEIIQPE